MKNWRPEIYGNGKWAIYKLKIIIMKQRVEDLKLAVAVDGKKLIDSKYTDQEIEDQITLIMNQNIIPDSERIDKMEEILSKTPDNLSITDSVEWVKNEIYKLVGWDKLPAYDSEFWRHFGSAPFSLKSNNNPKLDPKKGHKGMDEIFDNKFEHNGYHQLYGIPNFLYNLRLRIENDRKIKMILNTNVVSEYRTLDSIEEELPVKKAKAAAEILFKDKTIPTEERTIAFSKYGISQSWIYHPGNRFLSKIFDIYQEMDYLERHQNVECLYIVEWWLEELAGKRCIIDYKENQYHPSLKKKKRNYTPSKQAIERLKKYYTEIIIAEGVASFEFDW